MTKIITTMRSISGRERTNQGAAKGRVSRPSVMALKMITTMIEFRKPPLSTKAVSRARRP